MKFSVLLPTRNRLELLKYAVETVRRQDYDDWELIISDNFSDDDIVGYVCSLNEPRIKYFRTESFVPVTDNWNNALYKATGEYIIMLGDDDCLMKGYFSKIRQLIETYSNPDFIYTSAYLYSYPGVMPNYPDGFLHLYDYASFFRSSKEPFLLNKNTAIELVRQSMNLNMSFTYNMQHSIISRIFIDSLGSKGYFFQSPYPDFYATNVIFLMAKRILIYPIPIVTIGISQKSFGYYFFNNQEKLGVDFLKNLPNIEHSNKIKHILLPGSYNTTFWLLAMEAIKENYGSEFNLRVSYRTYRFKQILYMFTGYFRNNTVSKSEFHEFIRKINTLEKLTYGISLYTAYKLANIIPNDLRLALNKLFVNTFLGDLHLKEAKKHNEFKNILEVFVNVNPFESTETTPSAI